MSPMATTQRSKFRTPREPINWGLGAVADLSIGHIGQGGVDALLILIYCQHLVAQVPELLGHVAAKPPQADQ